MNHWFTEVLCWKYDGMVDSSTVANAYIWLTSKFGRFTAAASCDVMPALMV